MFYYLFHYLLGEGVPGSRLMEYVTVRSGAAFVLAMLIAIIFGRRIIDMLQKHQVGEIVRNLGLKDQEKKKGTPTMGGIIIIISIIVPCHRVIGSDGSLTGYGGGLEVKRFLLELEQEWKR